jgi:hypothetical protein
MLIGIVAVLMFAAVSSVGSTEEASAGLTPVPYVDPVFEDPYWGAASGETWPSTFPAQWASRPMYRVSVAARAMPPLSALGTVTLGVGAFSLGWKIGRVIDTKWLHLSGDIGVRISTTPEFVSWSSLDTFACSASWTANSCQGPGWYARTTSYSYYCDPYAHPYGEYWWGSYGCPYPAWLYDQMEALPGTKIAITNTNERMCGGWWGPCWVKRLTADQMVDLLIHSPAEPYTNQNVDAFTTIAAPQKTSENLQAARDSATSAGVQFQSEVNWALDPGNWDRPNPETGEGGGPRVEWPIPYWYETYQQYLSRLRNLGWLGQATVVDLEDNNGESNFIASGAPCTSVLSGTRLATDAPATFYRNPVALGSGDPSGGPLCGDADVSSFTSDLCSFFDWPWQAAMDTNGQFYSLACEEAWSLVRSLDIFNADGTVDSSVFGRQIAEGEQLKSEDLKEYLLGIDPTLEHWEKWSTPVYDQSGPRPFEVHFNWNPATQRVEYGRGFKVRFRQRFDP